MKKFVIIIPVLLCVYIYTLYYNKGNIDNTEEIQRVIKDNVVFPKVDYEVPEEDLNKEIDVSVKINNDIVSMPLSDYIIGVLACEMPASFNMEALKAGAVAIRTYYLYRIKNLPSYVATNNDQCYITNEQMVEKWHDTYDKYYEIIKSAVLQTDNEYILYNGEIIEAFYFSLSNGYTEDLENVYDVSRPYLVSVSSLWDKDVSSYSNTLEITKEEFLTKLGLENTENLDIIILSKNNSGRINYISINGVIFKGTVFRQLLGIRSTDFDINVNNNIVSITTRGYGHGIGMSQYGANEMAKLGYSYIDILKYYYTGVEISKNISV